MERRPAWQVRDQLRVVFLRCYDGDRPFLRGLRRVNTLIEGVIVDDTVPLSALPAWAAVMMDASEAEQIARYASEVETLASTFGW